ncbi:MAG: DNA polymerase III subunit delta' [bacterium]
MPFKDIIGHERVINLLRQLMRQERIPHAVLFAGPEGIGKRLTACGLAKALLCRQLTDDYCDQCPSCRSIIQGNHPDVAVIKPENNSIKIEQLREWQRELESKSYAGSWRITIIDQAEKITLGAANSILKILEEPPENTLICLIAVEPRNILPTILSRCQTVRFQPLSRTDFIRIVQEKGGLNEAQAGLMYNLSKGQLSRALNVDVAAFSTLRGQWRDRMIPPMHEEAWHQLDQASLAEGLEIIVHWWRDLLLIRMGIEGPWITNQDSLQELQREAAHLSPGIIRSRIDLILRTMEAIDRNANIRMLIDSFLMEWNNGPVLQHP